MEEKVALTALRPGRWLLCLSTRAQTRKTGKETQFGAGPGKCAAGRGGGAAQSRAEEEGTWATESWLGTF